jgi:hypothetical protein
MADEDLKAELERLRNENAALKKGTSSNVRWHYPYSVWPRCNVASGSQRRPACHIKPTDS